MSKVKEELRSEGWQEPANEVTVEPEEEKDDE
jgi:hypothetical protein